MKKLIILSAITISGLIYNTANAQIRIHFGINLRPRPIVYVQPAPEVVEQQPVYEEPAPACDDQQDQAYNDSNNDYYYLPDVDAYYNVNEQCYYYNDGDNWVSAAYLPGAYRDYDWRNCRRFEVRAPRPYLHSDFYRSRFNGHQFNGWAHADFHNQFNGGFANRGLRGDDHHFDNNAFRGDDHRFDNNAFRGDNRHFDNDAFRGNEQHFNNRGQDQHFENGGNKGNGQRFDNRANDHFARNEQPRGSGDHRGFRL